MRPKLWLSWSTGKDSAWALHVLCGQGEFEVVGLLTTGTSTFDRVSMHGVRHELAEEQARAAGVPLHWVELPYPCPNARYEAIMGEVVQQAVSEGVTHVAFGDLFLADIRTYRERLLTETGLGALFPLWHRPTGALLDTMLAAGVKARIVCLDPAQLDRGFAGRELDAESVAQLPAVVDPCGERGEFHTFVTAGPMFAASISVFPGQVVEREGFVYADLVQMQPA